MKRENFQSRLGFLLVSAGCAIGIGNVWKFPYVTGVNGGGVFVLFYIISLIIMGVPILTMELAVGRASRKSAVLGYKALEPKGSRWHVHGWLCVIGCCLLMMYYTTVSGWMLGYCFKFAAGTFSGMAPADVDAVWTNMLASPAEMALWMVLIVVAGFVVCSFGLQKGLERISKWMMICLLVLIVILAINSLTLDGAMEGVKFYLLPDFSKIFGSPDMFFEAAYAAMGQAFFTLSIGMGSMTIFGSYIDKRYRLTGEALRIDDRLNGLSGLVERRLHLSGFAQSFVNGALIYCVGAMAIIGALNDGLRGDASVLYIKSLLDGISSVVLGATLGPGVIFAALPVLVYQGAISLLAGALEPFLAGELLGQICGVGCCLVLCIGINFLGMTKIKTANMLPALLVPVLWSFLQPLFSGAA